MGSLHNTCIPLKEANAHDLKKQRNMVETMKFTLDCLEIYKKDNKNQLLYPSIKIGKTHKMFLSMEI